MAALAAAVAKKPRGTPDLTERKVKVEDDGQAQSREVVNIEGDIGEIEPDHYYEGGKVPVFKPTMDQFRSFKKFIEKIDKYGMKSGIVKVIPPKEWRDTLPPLDEKVKTIQVKNPIIQDFAGSQGMFRQTNLEKQRAYNLPEWRELSERSDHQPPARRGERRLNQDKVTSRAPRPAGRASRTQTSNSRKRGPGRPRKNPLLEPVEVKVEAQEPDRPPTPKSPGKPADDATKDDPTLKLEPVDGDLEGDDGTPSKPKGRQPKSVSSRRKHNRRAAADVVDEAAFRNFNYRITNQAEFTPERCEELERAYWRGLTNNNPLYGADMPGSLFDETTTSWNVAKLENLLDVLGQKLPGVNTAYLYLGMWKSTFAWHLEDVDLYSINYIHFGAPKQWYSISQEDARRFESAMKNVFPNDAKNCSQFLRHKTYLISPSLLQSQYSIRVNRLVHHEGEFVITFPYGYHSGYNVGYNCAESVNFATEKWLEYGRIAKKCNCQEDSVWVDVGDIERKLRGEEDEFEETEEEEEDGEDDDEEDEGKPVDLPTPPDSVEGKPKKRSRKRKAETDDKEPRPKVKRIRVRIKPPMREPCILCPNDISTEELLSTDTGAQAHRLCAIYTPETYIAPPEDGSTEERILNVANINKARLELKCNFCRSKRGACFQCSHKKCARAYHATCAAAAGVLVDMRDIPVFGEDGKEYVDVGIDFRCRFHRPKRPKTADGDSLEKSELIKGFARMLESGDVIQMQYYHGDIFAGVVVENRRSEEMVLIDVLPRGGQVEVEYKWVLAVDPADSQLPAPSANAQRMNPSSRTNKTLRTTQTRQHDRPLKDDPFADDDGPYTWAEFNQASIPRNPSQVNVDLSKPNVLWFYLGKTSTEAKAQYTEDPRRPRNNPESIFLESKKPGYRPPTKYPPVSSGSPPSAANGAARPPAQPAARQYEYKPKSHTPYNVDPQSLLMQQKFLHQSAGYQAQPAQAQQLQSGGSAQPRPTENNAPIDRSQPPAAGTSHTKNPTQRQQAPTANMSNGNKRPAPMAPMGSTAVSPAANAGTNSNNKSSATARTNGQVGAPVASMSAATNLEVRAGVSGSANGHTSPSGLSSLSSIYNPQTGLYRSPYAATYQANGGYKSPYAVGGGFANGYQPNPLKLQQLQQQQQQQQRRQQQARCQSQPQRLSCGSRHDAQKPPIANGDKPADPLNQQQQQQNHPQKPRLPELPELQLRPQPHNQGQFLQHQYNAALPPVKAEVAK
ncbi:MAG: hypothetical protein M1840_000069 [Geoglossum simile]|nr:MAG: hypothetical protein M1840_000069 [Geoglossum simile]